MQWLRACVRRCGRAASVGRWQVDGAGMGGEVRSRARGRAAHRGEGQRRGEGHRRVRPWGRRVCSGRPFEPIACAERCVRQRHGADVGGSSRACRDNRRSARRRRQTGRDQRLRVRPAFAFALAAAAASSGQARTAARQAGKRRRAWRAASARPRSMPTPCGRCRTEALSSGAACECSREIGTGPAFEPPQHKPHAREATACAGGAGKGAAARAAAREGGGAWAVSSAHPAVLQAV
jgi:hypothetical protein